MIQLSIGSEKSTSPDEEIVVIKIPRSRAEKIVQLLEKIEQMIDK